MYQIDTSTAVGVEPTPGAPGTPGYFTDGNPVGNIPATVVSADWLNAIQDELLSILAAAGITPSKATRNQVLSALDILIEARTGNYAVDTGTANAYVIALSPPLSSYAQNFSFQFRAIYANTMACTLDAGGGPIALDRDDGTALQAGDIGANSIVSGVYDLSLNKAMVTSIVPSQLGALAKLNIGALLHNDGSGNLAVTASDTLGTVAAVQVYNGNPNSHLAGNAGVVGTSAPSLCWDMSEKVWWTCTTTGNTAGAVWTPGGAGIVGAMWGGVSAGTSAAMTLSTTPGLVSLQPGQGIAFQVGTGLTNPGALTLNVDGFGALPVLKDGPTGPIALAGGEVVDSNIPMVRLNAAGTAWHLSATELGTAALANASSQTGTVAAVSGAITVGHIAVFSDGAGTVEDSGVSLVTVNGNSITSADSGQTVQPGTYLVDTTGGAILLYLATTLAGFYTFIDAANYWGVNNFTVNGNGHNIGAQAANVAVTFPADVSDYQFSLEATATYWRLV